MFKFNKIRFVCYAAIVLISGSALSACNKDKDAQHVSDPAISYGNFVNVGNGKARSFIINGAEGQPSRVGFNFTETALEGLPEHDAFFVLPMPEKNETLVDHISFDLAAHGHEPAGVYDKPHFDVHFYMVTEKEVDGIAGSGPEIDLLPPAKYAPKDYVPGPNVPKMGKHWIDSTGVELHNKPFEQTLIYGSYNGKFTFIEPMIAISYLQSKPNISFDVKPLGAAQKAGLYPQKYSINYGNEDHLYTISLDDLQRKEQM
jgi:hypothetical protein